MRVDDEIQEENAAKHENSHYTVKKVYFPVPSRDVTNQTLTGTRREQLNYSQPGIVWLLISRLRTGKRQTFFYSVLSWLR
jgi:hypothetical protein